MIRDDDTSFEENLDLSDFNFKMAYNALEDSSANLFITGGAGTGKSVILTSFYYRLLKRRKNVVVASPTGVSANMLHDKGIPATTLHSLFQLAPHPIFEEKIKLNESKKKVLRKLDCLLIDEISMVSPSLFDHIAWILDEVGFKGRVILFGDPLQLSPVVRLDDQNVLDYYISHNYIKHSDEHPQFYSSLAYKLLNFEVYPLTTIYRQENEDFALVLSHIRKGEETKEDLEFINKRVIRFKDYYEKDKNMLYLASTNERVNKVNNAYERQFTDKEYMCFTSESNGSMKKDEEDTIKIYKGEQVMCLHNNTEEDYQNGTLGIVKDFDKESVIIESNGERKRIVYETWTDYKVKYDRKTRLVNVEKCGTFTQIGCKPTFATTIHKAQGLTLDNVFVDLSSSFIPIASVYLALSRVRTIEGLGISRAITKHDIKVDENVKDFYRRLSLSSSAGLLSNGEYDIE